VWLATIDYWRGEDCNAQQPIKEIFGGLLFGFRLACVAQTQITLPKIPFLFMRKVVVFKRCQFGGKDAAKKLYCEAPNFLSVFANRKLGNSILYSFLH
jgi:hypothetical protein